MAQEIGIRIYKRENSEKWRPSRLCHFISARQPAPLLWRRPALRMAIVMATPVMRTPHQVNKVALNDVRKRRVKNKWGGQRVASRSRDRGIRCVREEEGRGGDGEGKKKWKTPNKKKKRMMEGAFVPVECWRCLESRCRSREKNISL